MEKDKRDESKCAPLRHQSTPPRGGFSGKTLNRCNGPIKDLNSPCSPENIEVRAIKDTQTLSILTLMLGGSLTHMYTCKLHVDEKKLEQEAHVRHTASPTVNQSVNTHRCRTHKKTTKSTAHRLLLYVVWYFF